MPSELARRDIRLARFRVWWNRWDLYIYVGGIFFCGLVLGVFGASFVDRIERAAMNRQHDDEIRRFRMDCRRTVDERDNKVKEATSAAATAATAAAQAVEAIATDATTPGAKK